MPYGAISRRKKRSINTAFRGTRVLLPVHTRPQVCVIRIKSKSIALLEPTIWIQL